MRNFYCRPVVEKTKSGRITAVGAKWLEGVWIEESMLPVTFVYNLFAVGLWVLAVGAATIGLWPVAWVCGIIGTIAWAYALWTGYYFQPRECVVVFEVAGGIRLSRGLRGALFPTVLSGFKTARLAGIEIEQSRSGGAHPFGFVRALGVDGSLATLGVGLHMDEAVVVARTLTLALEDVRGLETR